MIDHQVDILIVGGGLIGAALLQALKPTKLRCKLIDNQGFQSRMDHDFDARSIALSAASVRILEQLKLWSSIEPATAVIRSIHVSEQGRFGSACLQSNEGKPLGHVVDIQVMNQVLGQSLDPQMIIAPAELTAFDSKQHIATVRSNGQEQTIQARMVVAADGADSIMRTFCQLSCHTKEYDHYALVANIGLARAHDHRAYERFTTSGPLALLPLDAKRMALVWCLPPACAERLLHASEPEFLKTLSHAFGYRLGRLLKVGRRVIYPLRQVVMPEQISDGVVFIGNAAHTLHPVAGQGFNLGLRDVAMLAQLLLEKGLDHPHLFESYQQARHHDQTTITRATDFLIRLFSSSHRGVVLARQAGLLALDNNSFLKQMLSRYASGLAGVVPDLVCGIPLLEC